MLQRIKALNPGLANDITELKLPWYAIRNQAEGDNDESTAEVFIYDEIGGSFGVDANEFIQDLQGIKADNLTVRINSPGGSVIDAVAIYNALVQHPANVLCRVDSMAASAASIVAMAGDTVEMMVGSQIMIHDAMTGEVGNARELRELASWLDDQSDNIASIYAARGNGRTAEEWRAMMLAETWMFADEAVELGLADGVYTKKVKQALEELEVDPTEATDEDMPDEMMPEEEEEKKEAEALALLMNKRHVLTNRGYKFAGRTKAPNPCARSPRAAKSDDNLDDFIAGMQKVLGRK